MLFLARTSPVGMSALALEKSVAQSWACLSWSGRILFTEVKGLKTQRPTKRGFLH